MSIGAKIHKPPISVPKVSLDQCSGGNFTFQGANATRYTSEARYEGALYRMIAPSG